MIVVHSYDNISLFVALIDIPVRLDDLCQRKAAVNNCFHLACLDQACKEDKIIDLLACWPQTGCHNLASLPLRFAGHTVCNIGTVVS